MAAAALIVGCAATSDTSSSSNTAGSGASGSGNGSGGSGGGFSLTGGNGGTPTAVAHLQGKVVAPEGTIPISGALIYLVPAIPEAIPGGVYCDRCVELDASTPYTESAADGSFSVPAYHTGSQYLVVQKGQFRRVRQVEIIEGDQAVPSEFSTLPSKTDKAAGDDVPKMAILVGAWDDISSSLQKLGLDASAYDRFEYSFPPNSNDPLSPDKLLFDEAVMNGYHIVFTPCDSTDGTTCGYMPSGDSAVQQNLQQYVAKGGKLYVTDYSYDYIRQTWPEYIDWENQDSQFGSACLTGSYDAPAQVEDEGMKDWLAAQGITNFTLEENWTMIASLNTVATTDADGKAVDITPKNWVSGQTGSGVRPATVSFEAWMWPRVVQHLPYGGQRQCRVAGPGEGTTLRVVGSGRVCRRADPQVALRQRNPQTKVEFGAGGQIVRCTDT